jgi:hypothetical protein
MLVSRPVLAVDVTLTPVASVVAAAIAGEDPALIEPLMESLATTSSRATATRPRRSVCACILRPAVERALRDWEHDEELAPVTAVTVSIEIAAPPQAIWDVIMDPRRFGDWVTIHRRLGRVDDGDLREGFAVEQTLCLHHANFKVKWRLTECEEPRHAVWEGAGRPARTPAPSTT